MITTTEAAKIIGVTPQQLRNIIHAEGLEAKQIGGRWFVDKQSLEACEKCRQLLYPQDVLSPISAKSNKITALSFFSGALGLDIGLEKAGIDIRLHCEIDNACRRTIAANKPNTAMLGDISKYTAEEIVTSSGLSSYSDVDLIIGGPPCQAFSTAGSRRGFQDPRGNVFLQYIDLILTVQPRYAVIENVRGLLSAPLVHVPWHERQGVNMNNLHNRPGGALSYVLQKLREGGYKVSFNLYNAANYGVPQVRERVILICTREGDKVPYLKPTHSDDLRYGLPPWLTLKDAIGDLDGLVHHHVTFPEARLRFYRMLEGGQYWKHLPEDLWKEALGGAFHIGGGRTGFLRRLSWDKPSCTLVTAPNMPATDICHPDEDRPLSIEEYKRIQQFPDDWQLEGAIKDKYKQLGNAVPVGLGHAVGRAIVAHAAGTPEHAPAGFPFSRYKDTSDESWDAHQHDSVTKPLQAALSFD
jgi:DNA (cytosine-5)-methyltransferase 1